MIDGKFGSGDGGVQIKGLSATVRALSKAGADMTDMRELMHKIGQLVIDASNPPVKTGRLKNSLRAGKGKTKAVVRAGGARVPWAPIVEYGWPGHRKETAFLRNADRATRAEQFKTLDEGIKDILRKNNL